MLPLLGLNSYPITCYYIPVLMKKARSHCRRDFDKLIGCVTNTVSICARDEISPEQNNNFVNQNFQESAICEGGGISVPSLGSQCSSSFNKICSGFLTSYREKFASRPVDDSLCWWVDTVEVSLQIAIAKTELFTSLTTHKGMWGVEANSPSKGQKFHLGLFRCWARTSFLTV